MSFRNTVPDRLAQALQGFAVDGRKIRQLELSFRVRGKELRPASAKSPFPRVRLVFYDDNRAEVTETTIGARRDSFEWHTETDRIAVPARGSASFKSDWPAGWAKSPSTPSRSRASRSRPQQPQLAPTRVKPRPVAAVRVLSCGGV